MLLFYTPYICFYFLSYISHPVRAPLFNKLIDGFSSLGDHGTKVPNLYVEPGAAPDEWPVIEPPPASMTSNFESHTDSQLHTDQSSMPSDKINLQTHSEPEEVDPEEDSSVENLDHVGSATVSTRNLQVDNPGDASLTDNNMYEKIDSYQSHRHAFQSEEGAHFLFIPAMVILHVSFYILLI